MILPLPRFASTGRSMKKSASYSTLPAALRGALSRFTITRLRASCGSSSPRKTPFTRSYVPVLPKPVPDAKGSTELMVIVVSIADASTDATRKTHAQSRGTSLMIPPLFHIILAYLRGRYIERPREHVAHALPVRALPIHTAASSAFGEYVVVLANALGRGFDHVRGIGWRERQVAVQAQRKRSHVAGE